MQTESFSDGFEHMIFGVFSKESGEKVYKLLYLLILFFIVVSCQSTHSCGCEW